MLELVMIDSEKAVLKTIIYADIFDYPLAKFQVWQRLISKKRIGKDEVFKALKKLASEKRLGFKNGYYFLPGKEKLVDLRKEKELQALPKLKLAKKAAGFLSKIPFVSFVGLSGSLAFSTAKPEDDIDLVIITSPRSLWIARLLVYFFLKTKGKALGFSVRSPRGKATKDRLCLNVFVDESCLEVKESKQNLFTAYQILFLKPLVDRKNYYQRFLQTNLWIKGFLANAKIAKRLKKRQFSYSFLFFGFNCLFYLSQIIYMRGKPKAKVGFYQAFFHPQSKEKKVLSIYQKRCSKLSLTP